MPQAQSVTWGSPLGTGQPSGAGGPDAPDWCPALRLQRWPRRWGRRCGTRCGLAVLEPHLRRPGSRGDGTGPRRFGVASRFLGRGRSAAGNLTDRALTPPTGDAITVHPWLHNVIAPAAERRPSRHRSAGVRRHAGRADARRGRAHRINRGVSGRIALESDKTYYVNLLDAPAGRKPRLARRVSPGGLCLHAPSPRPRGTAAFPETPPRSLTRLATRGLAAGDGAVSRVRHSSADPRKENSRQPCRTRRVCACCTTCEQARTTRRHSELAVAWDLLSWLAQAFRPRANGAVWAIG